MVEEYRRRFGVDIRHEPFDFRKWYEILGEGLTQFVREACLALGPHVPIATGHHAAPADGASRVPAV